MGFFDKDDPQNEQGNLSTKKPDKEQDLMALVQALLATTKVAAEREARLARQEQEEEDRKRNKAAQYEKNRSSEVIIDLNKQKNCKHLKGGRNRRMTAAKDFAVYAFTLISGETFVRCTLCGMKWRPTDTIERVVRDGKVYKNHTGIGWREALLMTQESTNTAGRSEIPQSQWHKVPAGINLEGIPQAPIDIQPIGEYTER